MISSVHGWLRRTAPQSSVGVMVVLTIVRSVDNEAAKSTSVFWKGEVRGALWLGVSRYQEPCECSMWFCGVVGRDGALDKTVIGRNLH